MKVSKLKVEDVGKISLFFGKRDENLRLIEKELGVAIFLRDNFLKIKGEAEKVDRAEKLVRDIFSQISRGYTPGTAEIELSLHQIEEGKNLKEELKNLVVFTSSRGKKIRTRTEGQKRYVKAIKNNDVIFVIGPAGTGKTYLAVATAMTALYEEEVVRIVLTRPTVEVGEKLGYLPGGLEEKAAPYLRPLYDALYELILADKFHSFLERDIIEIAPLAYMRGRTLNDAFIILDEAQNTTYEQMKMFLTRLGFGSKVVVTGDITQIDLPPHKASGLVEVQSLFKDIKGIETVYLTQRDVVRHSLVQKIVKTYEGHEKRTKYAQKSK